jgi:hypothetical protein
MLKFQRNKLASELTTTKEMQPTTTLAAEVSSDVDSGVGVLVCNTV